MNNKTKEEEIKFENGHYKFVIDSGRMIYGVMACIGCMPSRKSCYLHDKN